MTEDTSSSSGNDIQINVKGPSELKLQISISPDKTVLELKQAIASKSDVEADRQRLIYSGRVLKDEDVLSTYKIQSNHTIHMVKGAARAPNTGSASTSTGGAPPQQLPTMQAGQNPADPLSQLNGHQGFGLMAGFNPFADMGLNPNDPNMLQTMMESPQFLQQMSTVMSNPAVMDQIMQANPQLREMAPQMREVFQSERFRELLSNPESLRTLLQMSSLMGGGAGGGPFGGGGFGGGAPAFPAPGLPTDGTGPPPSSTPATPSTNAGAGAGAGGMPPPFNPFMMGGLGGAGAGAGAGGARSPGAGAANPLASLEMLAQMQAMFGGGAGGGAGLGGAAGAGGGGGGGLYNPWASGAAATPTPPADPRPAEERFQVQLQQLQDMGFTNASQNVRALLATAGNVHAAIEYILGGGGL